jgi:hypothetical protein
MEIFGVFFLILILKRVKRAQNEDGDEESFVPFLREGVKILDGAAAEIAARCGNFGDFLGVNFCDVFQFKF